MTTTQLFNIQYPNCRTGMFSLRKLYEENPLKHDKSTTPMSLPAIRCVTKRNVQVQCSLLLPIVRHNIAVQTTSRNDDFDQEKLNYDEERILYARQSRKTIKGTNLPSNVKMICVRDNSNSQ